MESTTSTPTDQRVSHAHVVAQQRWSHLCLPHPSSHLCFDDGSALLLALVNSTVYAYNTFSDTPATAEGVVPQLWHYELSVTSPVLSLACSLDGTILAVQRSKLLIEFVHLQTGNTFVHGTHKGRSEIKGFFFTATPTCDFIIVTSQGLELSQYCKYRHGLRGCSRIKVPVAWYQYSHDSRMLLLGSGADASQLHAWQLCPKEGLVKLPSLHLNMLLNPSCGMIDLRDPWQLLAQMASRTDPRDIKLLKLYGAPFCAYIHRDRCQLLLYRLYRDAVLHHLTYALFSPHVELSTVDNVIVVHHTLTGEAALLDIRADTDAPIAAPLPLSFISLPSDTQLPAEPAPVSATSPPHPPSSQRSAATPPHLGSVPATSPTSGTSADVASSSAAVPLSASTSLTSASAHAEPSTSNGASTSSTLPAAAAAAALSTASTAEASNAAAPDSSARAPAAAAAVNGRSTSPPSQTSYYLPFDSQQASSAYASQQHGGWRYIAPNLVLDTKNFTLYRLHLDLAAVAHSCADPPLLVGFLGRRRPPAVPPFVPDPKSLLTSVLKRAMQDELPPTVLSSMFEQLARSYMDALADIQAAAVQAITHPQAPPPTHQVLSPQEVAREVFQWAREERGLAPLYLLAAVSEYENSMSGCPVPLPAYLHLLPIDVRLQQGHHYQVVLMLLHQPPSAAMLLAEQLADPARAAQMPQAAAVVTHLDGRAAIYNLQEQHRQQASSKSQSAKGFDSTVLEQHALLLLHRGQVVKAARWARNHGLSLQPAVFLDAAARRGSESAFLAVYRLWEHALKPVFGDYAEARRYFLQSTEQQPAVAVAVVG